MSQPDTIYPDIDDFNNALDTVATVGQSIRGGLDEVAHGVAMALAGNGLATPVGEAIMTLATAIEHLASVLEAKL